MAFRRDLEANARGRMGLPQIVACLTAFVLLAALPTAGLEA